MKNDVMISEHAVVGAGEAEVVADLVECREHGVDADRHEPRQRTRGTG